MTPEESALYRLLTLRPAGDNRRDGTDLFMEATDDAQFRRDCVKQMLEDLHEGQPDYAELGRKVWQRVELYAKGCPGYQDAVNDEMDEAKRLRLYGAI